MKQLILIAGFALAALASHPVLAAGAAGTAGAPDVAGDGPCKADLEKLCPGVKPGEGRLKACLRGKRDQISPECKKELASKRKQHKSG